MKNILVLFLSLIIVSCAQQPSEDCQALEAANSNVTQNIETVSYTHLTLPTICSV